MLATPLSYQKQGVLTGVGLNDEVVSNLRKQLGNSVACENLASEHRLNDQVEQGTLRADAILLGCAVPKPVSVAQKVHSFDKTIPVLILSEPDRCDELRQSIMFAPLLGSVVSPWSTEHLDQVGVEVRSAVERHHQRRNYLDSISSVQPSISKLSLTQPELGHYLGQLLDQAPIGVVSTNALGEILNINRRASTILGVREKEAPGLQLSEFFSKKDRPRLANQLMRSAVGQHFGMKPEVLQSQQSGSRVRYLETTVSRIVYRAGKRGYMVILQDVTAREIAELKRQHVEGYMRSLSSALEQAADSVMITDANRVLEFVNPAFEKLTGYTKEEAIGKKTYFLRSGTQDSAFYGELWETIRNGDVFRGVFVNRKKDGTVYHEEKTITPIRNNDGEITHFISTGHDITQRLESEAIARQRQEESAHAARLSTLGEMTSGIAHELSQPLCAITTYAQTCKRIINSDAVELDKLAYGLDQVVKQAQLAGNIFERLRTFSRKGGEPKRLINILEVVDEAVSLMESELNRKKVSVEVVKEVDQALTTADPVQIEQVLLNLMRNGVDAMESGEVSARRLTLTVKVTKQGIKVSVKDTGKGCDDETIDRLFEPFFTTKTSGLGIGLGISESIIHAHDGRLFLDQNTPQGATFSFVLPEQQEQAGDRTMEQENGR
ncbi:MAG: PAS domain-containing protein [Acidiferrobacterales bacterium]|nr:PAS domain-containing protein [Acidiferrobacterales bacterium]